MMNRCGPWSASALSRSTSSPPATVWFATTSVTSNGRPSSLEVDHDVLDRQPGVVLERLDQVAPHPAGGRRGQRRDDDLGDPAVGDRVVRGVQRIAVADLAATVDALLAHEREREVDAHLRGVAHGLVVDHVAVPRARLRDDDVEPRVALAPRARAPHPAGSRRRSSRSPGPGPQPSSALPLLAAALTGRDRLSVFVPLRPRAGRSRGRRPGRRTRRDRRRRSAPGRS